MVVATTSFTPLAEQVAQAYLLPDARIAVIEHPLGAIDDDAVRQRAAAAVEDVVTLLTGRR